ncbi:MAG: cellulase family glycosylhydrolase [Solirubrobacteraceae bacterium]
MTRILRILLALCAALVVALAAAGGAGAAGGGWGRAGIVRAPGGPWLTDAFGRRLQLHGVDLVAKCGGGAVPTSAPGSPCVGPARGPQPAFVLSPTASDRGRRFTAADAATLFRLGFNVVRLGIIWEGLEPGPKGVGPNDPVYCGAHAAGTPFPHLGAADPLNAAVLNAYLKRTDRIVALLAHAGIRVILDMHQDAWGSAFSNRTSPASWNGEGAPPWATCTGGAKFNAPPLWSNAYFDPAVKAAVHSFFANDVRGDLQGQFARVWQAVARHYRNDPNVIGYEIYNEPADFAISDFDPELECDYGGPAHEPTSCRRSGAQALRDGLIGAIQAADPNHVVFYEPGVLTDFGQRETIGIAEPLRFRRVALAFHMYGDPAQQLPLIASERAATVTEQPGGPPSVMDEFGATNDAAMTATTVILAGRSDLSWSYWSGLQLHDPTGSPDEALIDQRTRRPYPAKARALAVPYASATAGTPRGESFTGATFRYSYTVESKIRAPTVIVVPRLAYPHGYRVRVRGATLTSGANAPLLDLRSKPGARIVQVTVSRKS